MKERKQRSDEQQRHMTTIETRVRGTRLQASTWEGSVMKIKSSRSD
jgi:hypothetical protein